MIYFTPIFVIRWSNSALMSGIIIIRPIFLCFLPSVVWNDPRSGSSRTNQLCKRMALKRCMMREFGWKRKRLSRSSPLEEAMRRLRALRKSTAELLITLAFSIAIGWKKIRLGQDWIFGNFPNLPNYYSHYRHYRHSHQSINTCLSAAVTKYSQQCLLRVSSLKPQRNSHFC